MTAEEKLQELIREQEQDPNSLVNTTYRKFVVDFKEGMPPVTPEVLKSEVSW